MIGSQERSHHIAGAVTHEGNYTFPRTRLTMS